MFRSTRSLHLPTRELPLSPDTTVVLHQVYNLLLGLLGRAKLYVDASVHGTTKLVQYFSFMTYCLISKTEKLMFSGYFMDLWNLFQVCSFTCDSSLEPPMLLRIVLASPGRRSGVGWFLRVQTKK